MPAIAFWNVQRLGDAGLELEEYHGSKAESKDDIIETVIKEIFAGCGYSYMLMSEVMYSRPGAFNPAIKGKKKERSLTWDWIMSRALFA